MALTRGENIALASALLTAAGVLVAVLARLLPLNAKLPEVNRTVRCFFFCSNDGTNSALVRLD